MIVSLLSNAFTVMLVLIFAAKSYALQPCDPGAATLVTVKDVIRTQNNEVRLFGESYMDVLSQWPNYYVPRVSARGALNTIYLTNWTTSAPPNWSDHALVQWYYNLQQTGVGNYQVFTDHWANSPYCEGFGQVPIHYTFNKALTILRPARPDYSPLGGPVTFLGSGISNDGPSWNLAAYRSNTPLVLGNANGAAGTPNWQFSAGSSFATLNCTNCTNPVFTASRKSSGCQVYDVVLRVDYGGLLSDPMFIFINAPHNLISANDNTGGVPVYTYPFGDGYQTRINYFVQDLCGNNMWDYNINESFNPIPFTPEYPGGNTWTSGPAEGGIVTYPGKWWDTVDFQSGACSSLPCVPTPLNPGADFTPVHSTTQTWAAGSATPGQGAKVQINILRRYRDEARHDTPITNPAVP